MLCLKILGSCIDPEFLRREKDLQIRKQTLREPGKPQPDHVLSPLTNFVIVGWKEKARAYQHFWEGGNFHTPSIRQHLHSLYRISYTFCKVEEMCLAEIHQGSESRAAWLECNDFVFQLLLYLGCRRDPLSINHRAVSTSMKLLPNPKDLIFQ